MTRCEPNSSPVRPRARQQSNNAAFGSNEAAFRNAAWDSSNAVFCSMQQVAASNAAIVAMLERCWQWTSTHRNAAVYLGYLLP
jgi:hypothetical protein